ncbi:MAG: septum site-determining protein MinD [Clostridiales bacterium]|nr:septum site-determining protein MinD [Clostridiales bacterium]
MAKKYVVTSGKGGVGKTTITANLGLKLSECGKRVAVVDGDIGLNNLDVLTCVENKAVFDLTDAINGRCRVKQTLVESPLNKNLFVLPSCHTLSSTKISGQDIKNAIDSIDGLFDYIFIDSPAGIDAGFHRAVSSADGAIVVVTPTITSVRDADKVISILKSYPLSDIFLIVNKIRGDLVLSGSSLSESDIENTLKTTVLGVVPEDDLLNSLYPENLGVESAKAIKLLALKLQGKSTKTYDYLKKYSGFWGSIRKELKKWL